MSPLVHAARVRVHDPLHRAVFHEVFSPVAHPPARAHFPDRWASLVSHPPPRHTLSDVSNDAFDCGQIVSSSRAADAHTSLLDVRKAAAAVLPRKIARKPAKANVLVPSSFRPHVPADRSVLLWTAPYSTRAHFTLQEQQVQLNLQARIFEALLGGHVTETNESYSAGLVHFTQFCERLGIGEEARMPASCFLLAAFVADAAGSCSGKCIRNWLCGLQLWHLYNDAPWHGDEIKIDLDSLGGRVGV